jgi:hypothetical protein
MKQTKKIYKKSRKSKIHKKSRKSKNNNLRKSKRIRFTKNRSHKGGYTWLENWNLKKYANDEEVQSRLAAHFNEPSVVGNPKGALSILKANNSLFKSINDLFKEIGINVENYDEKIKLMKSNKGLKQYDEQMAREDVDEERSRKREADEELMEIRRKEVNAEKRAKMKEMEKERAMMMRIEAENRYDNKHRDEVRKSFPTYGVDNTSRNSYINKRQ